MPIPGLVITPLPDWTANYRPPVNPDESYHAYLERAIDRLDSEVKGALLQGATLERYFGFDELVVPSYRGKRMPPRELWPNMVLPLALALLLRQTQVAQGFGPLLVVAAYRPASERSGSRHKLNAAIDLRPVTSTVSSCRALLVGAAWLWREHEFLNIGVGQYGARPDRTGLTHIDAGVRTHRTVWRYNGDDVLTPSIPNMSPAPWEL